MRNTIAILGAASCLFFSSCQRPVAYFQPTAHPAAARLPIEKANQHRNAPTDVASTDVASTDVAPTDVAEMDIDGIHEPAMTETLPTEPGQSAGEAVVRSSALASLAARPHQTTASRIGQHMQHVNTLLAGSAAPSTDQQPGPKPKKKLKLGNQIRQSLGMKLRPELNWWQRISWKLKASVFVILLAVVFALLHVTVLAIIFGIIGALLLISGLKKSFKVRRPWF